MGETLKLEDRELLTIADLVRLALVDGDPEKEGSYRARSLVRLALVIDQHGREKGWGNRLEVLNDAPGWVYRYFARPFMELAAPSDHRPKAGATGSRRRKGAARKTRKARPKPEPVGD